MKPRILVNLAFFGVLTVALGIWAISDVLQIDLQDPPYEITADFVDSPGLQTGYDVGYLGTPIGRIDDIELQEGRVRVTMAIEDGRRIPEDSEFAVRRKSAVGEPYVDIIPPEGAEVDGPAMEEGDHVPVERTLTPLSYSELFAALNDLVGSVPEDDLATLMDEMATALDGRAGSLRDLITGSDDSLETFAENADLLESSTASLSRLARVFADHRTAMAEGLRNSEVVTSTLAEARADLERVMVDGSSLATRTADLLDRSGDDLSCTLGGLSSLAAGLNTAEVRAALADMFRTAPDAAFVFRDIIAWEADGPYVRAIPPLNVGASAEPVPVFDEPRPLPDVAAVPACEPVGSGTAPGGAGTAGAGGSGEADGPISPASDPGAEERADAEEATSDRDVDTGTFNPLWIVAALLAVALVAALRPWRFLNRGS
ncbi:MAG TPA: MlaD family protein [Acidimicrobiales bacterium]|nr:MlaD family protein [Acidimicrobiales bacterium]